MIPTDLSVPGNLRARRLGIVIAPDFSVAIRSGLAITSQINRIPITQPSATNIVLIPSAKAWPVNPRINQADSPVALSERANDRPPIFFPPIT